MKNSVQLSVLCGERKSVVKKKKNMENKKNNTWEIILRIIIGVASAIAGALGVTACVG